MRKIRVFKLKVVKLCKWVFKPKRKPTAYGDYLRLNSPDRIKTKTMTKISRWGRCLTERLRLSLGKRGYARVGQALPVTVPKGHLAVYVGQKDDDPHRYLVPVIYFNHPLFSELLREAEEEYGFQHPGGITIPCPASEFEKVQTRIAAGVSCRKLTFWRPS